MNSKTHLYYVNMLFTGDVVRCSPAIVHESIYACGHREGLTSLQKLVLLLEGCGELWGEPEHAVTQGKCMVSPMNLEK